MNTLGYHRKNCAAVFGEDSPATKFLDEKIAESGADDEVMVAEKQFVMLLAQMHFDSLKARKCSECSDPLDAEDPSDATTCAGCADRTAEDPATSLAR